MLSDKQIAFIMRNGHQVHADRSTYTHSVFWNEVKHLKPEHEITENGSPIWIELVNNNNLCLRILFLM